MTLLKNNDWGVLFLCFAKQKHIPAIKSPDAYVVEEIAAWKT